MTANYFTRTEDGLETITLPVCRSCGECMGYDCIDDNGTALAMAYVPMQKYDDIYTTAEAYSAGTLFKALDKPFLGKPIAEV